MTVPRQWQFTLLVVLVVLVVFFPACGFDFLFYDDRVNVRDNLLIRDFSFDNFLQFWRRPYEGLYIPLTYTVWGLLAKVAGDGVSLDPAPFHFANLILHAATATALFSLLRLLVKDDWAAVGGALFFALHPLVVEPVAWVSELKGLLSGFFSVMALRQYLLYCASTEDKSRHPLYRYYLLATMFFVAALLAKPSALVLPLLAGLIGYFPRVRSTEDLLTEMVPWLVLAAPLAIITKYAQPSAQLPFIPDFGETVLVACDALVFYFGKLNWPFGLAPDYGRIPAVVLAGERHYLGAMLPLLLLFVATRTTQVRRWLIILLITPISLLPVLGFIPFTFQGTSTVADRYLYLGLIGPALGMAMLLARYRAWIVRLIAVVGLLGLAVISSIQLRYWRDTPTLKNHVLKVNPKSWVAHHNLGMFYRERNQFDRAIEHYKAAIRNRPGFYLSYYNLAYLQDLINDHARAVDNYKLVISMKPDFIPAYNNLGAVYQKMGFTNEAIQTFEKSILVKPDFSGGHLALGRLYQLKNRREEAVASFKRFLRLRPTPEIFNELGLLYLEMGRFDEAEAALKKALELGYDSNEPLEKLAEARRTAAPVQADPSVIPKGF